MTPSDIECAVSAAKLIVEFEPVPEMSKRGLALALLALHEENARLREFAEEKAAENCWFASWGNWDAAWVALDFAWGRLPLAAPQPSERQEST